MPALAGIWTRVSPTTARCQKICLIVLLHAFSCVNTNTCIFRINKTEIFSPLWEVISSGCFAFSQVVIFCFVHLLATIKIFRPFYFAIITNCSVLIKTWMVDFNFKCCKNNKTLKAVKIGQTFLFTSYFVGLALPWVANP